MENSRRKKLLAHGELTKVAMKAGVSKATVSEYLSNQDAKLLDETKENILTAIEQVTSERRATAKRLNKRIAKLLTESESIK